MKRHNRPHKCKDPDCEYSFIGFLTESACQQHWEKYHRKPETTSVGQIEDVRCMNAEDMLLLDKIKSNDIVEVRKLWPPRLDRDRIVRNILVRNLVKQALASGSISMIRLVFDSIPGNMIADSSWQYIFNFAVAGEDYEVFRCCFLNSVTASSCATATVEVMKSTSLDMASLWQDCILQASMCRDSSYFSGLFFKGVLISAEKNPMQEERLLQTWQQLHARGSFDNTDLGSYLAAIGDSSCSIPQAAVLLKLGAYINHHKTSRKTGNPLTLTALHSAAKHRGEKAARFMEFLLLHGADPTIGFRENYPANSKGAQEIQRWLGMTWDELVQKTNEERSLHK